MELQLSQVASHSGKGIDIAFQGQEVRYSVIHAMSYIVGFSYFSDNADHTSIQHSHTYFRINGLSRQALPVDQQEIQNIIGGYRGKYPMVIRMRGEQIEGFMHNPTEALAVPFHERFEPLSWHFAPLERSHFHRLMGFHDVEDARERNPYARNCSSLVQYLLQGSNLIDSDPSALCPAGGPCDGCQAPVEVFWPLLGIRVPHHQWNTWIPTIMYNVSQNTLEMAGLPQGRDEGYVIVRRWYPNGTDKTPPASSEADPNEENDTILI